MKTINKLIKESIASEMASTEELETTAKLIHRLSVTAPSGRHFNIKISLNDECKNGHEDFHITGDYWEAGVAHTQRNMAGSWSIGDHIAKDLPEFKLFNLLHGCDFNGVPMHFLANGHYHLKQGFNNTKPSDETFDAEYCEYYRMTPEEMEILKGSFSQLHFAILVGETNIIARYKEQAKEAITQLENWTGKTFQSQATRSNLIANDEDLKAEAKRIEEGYYTEEARLERMEASKVEEFKKLEAKAEKKIELIKEELEIDKAMFKMGITNYIFYSHSRTLKFNWKGYEAQVSNDQILAVHDELKDLIFEGLAIVEEEVEKA